MLTQETTFHIHSIATGTTQFGLAKLKLAILHVSP